MKHLKIAFAIVFFCLLGGINAELMAQQNPSKLTFAMGRMPVGNQFKLEILECEFVVHESSMYIYIKEPLAVREGSPSTIWKVEFSSKAATWGLTADGNFTVCDSNGAVIWETGTAGRGGSTTSLQLANGNLVVANGDDDPDVAKQIKDKKTLIESYRGKAIWATGTCSGVVNGCGVPGPR
jgi:hypothetical protein